MKNRYSLFIRFPGFAVLACAFLFIGCGDTARSPLSTDDGAALTEQPDTGVALAKKAGKGKRDRKDKKSDASIQRVETATKTVSDRRGGKLKVGFTKYGGPRDVTVAKAELSISKKSIIWKKSDPEIQMVVSSGTSLEQIEFVFQPSGMAFRPNAKLTVYLRGPVKSKDVENVVHIFGEGSEIEKIKTVTDRHGEAFLEVKVRVPGFSRYSLGDGSFAPEADGPMW
jgi:hypothetical protein